MKKTMMVGVCAAAFAATAASAGSSIEAVAGEPRVQVSMAFGGGSAGGLSAANYSVSFGLSRRMAGDVAAAPYTEHLLPITGVTFTSGSGIAPIVLGVQSKRANGLRAAEDDSSISWGWILGGVAATLAITAVLAGDSDSGNGFSGSGNRNTTNGVGPSDGDGECDLASSNQGGFTLVEDECLNP